MKKIFILFFIVIVNISLFAAEITFSSGVGCSVYTVQGFDLSYTPDDSTSIALSGKRAVYNIPAPSVGLDMHFAHEASGFTFSLINNTAFPVALYKKGKSGNTKMQVNGFIYDWHFLLGYTYGIKKPLSIHAGIGSGFVAGQFGTYFSDVLLKNAYAAWTPVAVHLRIQYIFTEHLGIAISLYDMVNIAKLEMNVSTHDSADIKKHNINGMAGYGNVFTLKLTGSYRI